MNKKRHGQFFTQKNPFTLQIFCDWFALLPKNTKLLEPFAGANNIVKMINETFGEQNWTSFDIEPPKENFAKNSVLQKDTLLEMPSGFDAIITNPPYLAKNSATRSGIDWIPENKFDDLYKFSLQKMLEKYDFIAAIIPESFITSGQFRKKLFAAISLTQTMFDDTEVPVCIALFTSTSVKKSRKLAEDDFELFQMDRKIGTFCEISRKTNKPFNNLRKNKLRFNDPQGIFGLHGVDGTNFANIGFVDGKTISPERIKNSSRAISRIGLDFEISDDQKNRIINEANKILANFRETSDDILMTSFKGLRKDGRYRRRLDFSTAAKILDLAISRIILEQNQDFSDLPIFTDLAVV